MRLAALHDWLQERLKASLLEMSDVTRHAAGFSWETWTFTAEWRSDQQAARQGFALRMEPERGLLPPYDAQRDHSLHAAVQRHSSVPLPRLLWLETDPTILGRPFYVMERVEGIVPVPWQPHDPRVFPTDAARLRLGEHFVDVMAQIHAVDIHAEDIHGDDHDIAAILADPGADTDTLARTEIRRWGAVIEDAALVREPVLDAAVLWLDRNVATSGRRALVHGDYRIGNVMVGTDGLINAVFDWELAHIGDPVFDLAWASLKLYGGRSGLMSRLLPIDEALTRYSRQTGLVIHREVFRFWTVFCHLRALAPYLRAAEAFQSGETDDVRLANMGHQSGHLLKFLAEELGLRGQPSPTRPAPTPPSTRTAPTRPSQEMPMMQNTPDRLLRGAAQSVRSVIDRIETTDPYVHAQLRGAAELLDNLAPRIEWDAAGLAELLRNVGPTLREAVAAAPGGALPRSEAALEGDTHTDSVVGLQTHRDAHLAALAEVQTWLADQPAEAHTELRGSVHRVLAWQLDTELSLLRAGSTA